MDKRVYMLTMIAFVVGMSELIVGGILDLIAQDLHIRISTAGLLITVFAFVFALAAPLLLVVFSKVERTKLISLALIVFIVRSEEHTSELQSRFDLVCRLLLEKKKTNTQ